MDTICVLSNDMVLIARLHVPQRVRLRDRSSIRNESRYLNMAVQFNAYVLYYWWGGAALLAIIGALARRRFAALGKILLGAAAAALGVWLQQQLPESVGFAVQAVCMLASALLILLGIVATFTAETR